MQKSTQVFQIHRKVHREASMDFLIDFPKQRRQMNAGITYAIEIRVQLVEIHA